jgi:predicted transcriptional regulator
MTGQARHWVESPELAVLEGSQGGFSLFQMAELSRAQLRRLAGGPLLGPLETEIMAVVWKRGGSTVREIVYCLHQKAAYTTVLSTVSRLLKKGLLRKESKAWKLVIYSPVCTEQEWQWLAARAAVERFLATPNVPRDLLVSSLQEALGK